MRTCTITRLGTIALLATLSTSALAHRTIDLSEMETRMTERFNAADANGDALLSAEEFATIKSDRRRKGKGHRRANHRNGEHKGQRSDQHKERWQERRAEFEAQLFTALDTDGNGELSQSEASFEAQRDATRALHRQRRFERLDTNADGQLTAAEFSARLARMTQADANGDGQLDRDERRAARKAHQRERS